MFGLQCVYYTVSVVTSDWAAGPQSQPGGWSSFLEEKENSDVSVCEERWSGVKYLESYTSEDEETALNDLNVCTIRKFKCLIMQL